MVTSMLFVMGLVGPHRLVKTSAERDLEALDRELRVRYPVSPMKAAWDEANSAAWGGMVSGALAGGLLRDRNDPDTDIFDSMLGGAVDGYTYAHSGTLANHARDAFITEREMFPLAKGGAEPDERDRGLRTMPRNFGKAFGASVLGGVGAAVGGMAGTSVGGIKGGLSGAVLGGLVPGALGYLAGSMVDDDRALSRMDRRYARAVRNLQLRELEQEERLG